MGSIGLVIIGTIILLIGIICIIYDLYLNDFTISFNVIPTIIYIILGIYLITDNVELKKEQKNIYSNYKNEISMEGEISMNLEFIKE